MRSGRARTAPGRAAVLLLACLFSTPAAAFLSSPYFPLPDGASWTYVARDGVTTETRTVTGTTTFNGAQVKVVRDQTGTEQYFTNDASGVRFHGGFFVDAVSGNETDFYTPPIALLARQVTIGSSSYSSGALIAVEDSNAMSLSYSSTTTPVAIEAITVAAGTFANALRVQQTVYYSGTVNGSAVNFSRTLDAWLVAGIGSVREVSRQSTSVATTIWELQSYNVPDLIPDAFAFPAKSVDTQGMSVVSDLITVRGVAAPVPMAIVGGSYQINGGAFSTEATLVNDGDRVVLQVVSAQPGYSSSATLEIGGVTAAFIVTTITDATPAPFSFAPVTGAPPGVVLASAPIRILGINIPAPISVVGGEYSIRGEAFTSAPSTLCVGCQVEVRIATAAGYGETTSATLTIGGVSALFSVTTLRPTEGPFWELFFSSETGDYIGLGRSQLFHFGPAHPETAFTAKRDPYNTFVRVNAPDYSFWWDLDLDAGNGALGPGRYEGALGFPGNGAVPGILFQGDGRGCTIAGGRFEVLEIAYGPDDQVQRLAANFEQRCQGTAARLFGQVRINSTFPLGTNVVRRRLGDVNADGFADILWRNMSTGENYLYLLTGTQILGGEGYLRRVADMNWKIAGTGDFDGDGRADILWRNSSTGENYIYLLNGTSIVGEGFIRTVADQSWQVAGIGDFDGDGKDDILWRNIVSGENYLYPMAGTSIKPTEGYLRAVADPAWRVAGIGDFDGDGKSDILWRNSSTGENYLYLMDGTAIKSSEGFVRTVADTAWQVKGVGDFDGDGKADIVWRNSSSGQNYLYPMDGTAIKPTEGYIRTVANLAWQIVAVGDYDGDGKSDLLWRNSSTGENYLYPMDGTTIKPTEGYLRSVPDQNWQVQR